MIWYVAGVVAQATLAWLVFAMAATGVPTFRVLGRAEVVSRYLGGVLSGIVFGGLVWAGVPVADGWVGAWLGVLVGVSAVVGTHAGLVRATAERATNRGLYGIAR